MTVANLVLKAISVVNNGIPKKSNKIVFFSRPDYSDNCRALYEKIKELEGNKYDITWVVQDVEAFRRKHPQVKCAKHRSISSLWSLLRSHYIIRTHSFWDGIYAPKKQIMCYAFHGMGIKGFEFNIKERYPHNSFDNFTVTSSLFAEMFSENLNADLERFIITGLPRNDYLFDQPKDLMSKIYLTGYKKYIVWMPTFRENRLNGVTNGSSSISGLPVVSIDGLERLNEALAKKDYILLIKMHQWAAECFKGEWSNIKNITDDDIPEPYTFYHFLGLMDVLLTDYSSVSTDFLLLNRPIGYVFDDLDEFRKTRYLPLDPIEQYMAGPIINTEDKLIDFINSLDMDNSEEKRKKIRQLFLENCDDKSSERCLKAIGILA